VQIAGEKGQAVSVFDVRQHRGDDVGDFGQIGDRRA
jgi:hypothetical protein